MENKVTKINLSFTLLLFGVPSLIFYISMYYVLPVLHDALNGHISIAYFIAAGTVFILIFAAVFYGVRKEGFKGKDILVRLRLNSMSRKDWLWALNSILVISLITGLIYYLQKVALPDFTTSPPFFKMEKLLPSERWILLIWLFVFFFNIFGEELFWRGFILPGQELCFKKKAWMVNSAGWLIFHLSFGLNLLIMLLPIIIILPYIAQKRESTTPGIIIHAVLNGPTFIMIALGII